MNYTVLWKNAAKNRLEDIWLSATDRTAITRAADEIDQLLRKSPYEVGESREAEHRILFIEPLVVEYAVSEADRKVHIAHVRSY